MHTIISDSSELMLAVGTIVLAVATILLARHTKTLSRLTSRLVSIEEDRDKRDEKLKRRGDLTAALNTIEELRNHHPSQFIAKMSRPKAIPEPENTLLRKLHNYMKYIKDPICRQYIDHLIQVLDDVQLGSSIGGNGPELENELAEIQKRMGWSITEWRNEIAN